MNAKYKTGLRGMALMVLALLFLLPSPAAGQEFIKEAINVKGDVSIVRTWSDNVWMVYYEVVNTCYFTKVTSWGTTADYIYLDGIISHVYDFEILGDMLYFCGTSSNNTAVMGYFQLTGFPSSLVYYCTVPLLASCRKLDAADINGTRHVIMTGDAILGTSHIVDACSIGSNQWNFNYSNYTDANDFYDDVAITDNYVVISVRDTSDKKGSLYQLSKPAYNTSLFPQSGILCYDVVSNPQDIISLDHSMGDTVAYLVQTGVNAYTVNVCHLSTPTMSLDKVMTLSNVSSQNEIRYNASARRADVLMYDSANSGAIAYHVPNSVTSMLIPFTINLSGHHYTIETLMSLDELSNGRFIASGRSANGLLCLCRYSYNAWQPCTYSTSLSATYPHPLIRTNTLTLQGSNDVVTMSSIYCVSDEIIINTTDCTR